MTDQFWEYFAGSVILAIIYMCVRPGSPGVQIVKDVTNALTSMLNAAEDAPKQPNASQP